MNFKSLVFIFVTLLCGQHAVAGTWADASAVTAAGTRNYRVWIPNGYQPGSTLPMILMVHGCTQNPTDFAAGTQMNALADEYKFFAVYPEQPSSANGSNCWNWFETAHQARAAGEPSILARIVADVRAGYSIRADKIYAAGMSAGAAMTVILGATYPDLFAGIGVCAGLEYRAGTDVVSGVLAQEVGGPDPNAQGRLAFNEMGTRARRMPTIVFHGTLDVTVQPVNGTQVFQQWAQTNDLIDDGFDNNSVDAVAEQTVPGMVPNGRAYTRSVYHDAANRPLIEFWSIEQMRHAWSGGSSAGSYTDPTGPSASREMVRFFALDLAPSASGATLGGRVTSADGRGLANVIVTVSGGGGSSQARPRSVRTNSFGQYRFARLPTGASYQVSVSSKRYSFAVPLQTVSLNEDFFDADFVGAQ